MKHYNVAVLRGGPSFEYEVSLKTGLGVLQSLKESGVKSVDIVINRQGEWLLNGFVKQPHQALSGIDIVFIALHGSYGEDGTVQRLLDLQGIPYTGSKPFPSAVAMNKVLTKEYLSKTGIKVPPHMKVARDSGDLTRVVQAIDALFGPKYVIKPINGGSSVDTHITEGVAGLHKALSQILQKYDEVMVEQRITGREATVGIINNFRNKEVYSLPAIEILPPSQATFFDYESKYGGESEEICPGRFTNQEKEELETLASIVHKTLELSQYSRSDFIIGDKTEHQAAGIYFLEVNTLPGLTSNSLLPKALNAVGCTYNDFITHLISDTVSK